MSLMVECDRCKKKFYADCRTDKGAYVKAIIEDQCYGTSLLHICRKCYMEIFPSMIEEGMEELL